MSIGVAKEKGTFSFDVTFTDETGAGITPNTVTWTLSRTDGSIVNSREDVSETPAATVTITLSGNDLAIITDDDIDRIVTVKIDYDSSIGNGLPQHGQDTFTIESFSQVVNG